MAIVTALNLRFTDSALHSLYVCSPVANVYRYASLDGGDTF